MQHLPTQAQGIITCNILPHILFAVVQLASDSPKDGRTVTLTFWVSHAAIAKVTGGLPFAVLQYSHSYYH